MALTNAERQRLWRERRNRLAKLGEEAQARGLGDEADSDSESRSHKLRNEHDRDRDSDAETAQLEDRVYALEMERGQLREQVRILSQTRREGGRVYVDAEVLAAELLPLLDEILQNEKVHPARYVPSVAPWNVVQMQRLIKAWLAGESISRDRVPFRSNRQRAIKGPWVEPPEQKVT